MDQGLIPGIGAAVAMVAGAVVRAWYRERREDRREAAKQRALTPATGHALPMLPAADCARHASNHAESLARTHTRINQVLDLMRGSDQRVDTIVAKLDRVIDRLDDIKDWTRPTGEK